jgi:hypothetical protein
MCEGTGASTACSLQFPAILDVDACTPVGEVEALQERHDLNEQSRI